MDMKNFIGSHDRNIYYFFLDPLPLFMIKFGQIEEKPFWTAKFFVTEPTLFGTWDGVYTSCLIHLFGIITLLRAGWIVVSCSFL